MGLTITLQALGQDFNNSRGLCGNFNGLRDDDFDFIDPALEQISPNLTNKNRSQCDHTYSYDQAKINHMMTKGLLGDLNQKILKSKAQQQFSAVKHQAWSGKRRLPQKYSASCASLW